MEVGVAELRAHLSSWLAKAGQGEEIVITDRGRAVARLVSPGYESLLERLVAEGLVTRPKTEEGPVASKQKRVKAQGSVSDFVSALRD